MFDSSIVPDQGQRYLAADVADVTLDEVWKDINVISTWQERLAQRLHPVRVAQGEAFFETVRHWDPQAYFGDQYLALEYESALFNSDEPGGVLHLDERTLTYLASRGLSRRVVFQAAADLKSVGAARIGIDRVIGDETHKVGVDVWVPVIRLLGLPRDHDDEEDERHEAV